MDIPSDDTNEQKQPLVSQPNDNLLAANFCPNSTYQPNPLSGDSHLLGKFDNLDCFEDQSLANIRSDSKDLRNMKGNICPISCPINISI